MSCVRTGSRSRCTASSQRLRRHMTPRWCPGNVQIPSPGWHMQSCAAWWSWGFPEPFCLVVCCLSVSVAEFMAVRGVVTGGAVLLGCS